MQKVLKSTQTKSTEFDFVIVDSDQIEVKDWSEIYNSDGIQSYDEVQDIEAEMIEYRDGHNWQTDVIDDGNYPYPALEKVSRELSEIILAELEQAEFPAFERGFSRCTVEDYKFTKSQYAHHYGILVEYAR